MTKTAVLRGARLKAARQAAGLRQHQLAALLDTTQGHLSALERETRAPSVEMLKSLANAVGVSVHWLCGDEDPAMSAPSPMTPDHILSDPTAAPGLLALAADAPLVASLDVQPEEWGYLQSMRPPGRMTKQGYLMVLLATRANIEAVAGHVKPT